MRAEDCTYFESRATLRAWLLENHARAGVLQLGLHKRGSGRPSVTYWEALDEALCFGWIDGVRHAIDHESFTQRFTPRRPGSRWSIVNIKRVEALIARGLMHESGLRAFEQRDPDAPRPEDRTGRLPPSTWHASRRPRQPGASSQTRRRGISACARSGSWTPKKEETRQRRLQTLIADSEAARRIGPLTRSGKR